MTDASRPGTHDGGTDDAARVSLALDGTREAPVIRLNGPGDPAEAAAAILARAEALTAADTRVLRIGVEADPDTAGRLLALGAARRIGGGVEILPGLLWQCAARWLPAARPPSPSCSPSRRAADTRCGPRRRPARSTRAPSPGSAGA
ncbi:hypothetical protein M6G65_09010 [Methylobacterium tardum]|uniref:hypothetical protein n=1 Tax=Methylobacterium tardum TaxID=374432 RepID=UPI0020218659|nr:hypothetical protein [Methylobacterium tardum]URD38547.1 hypothetical protein M6G65_09010 [Methylobacterium tardum]